MKKGQAQKRKLIMEKAEELFSIQGYQTTTISQIARACNISEAGIYEYFLNKEDLLFSIPERHFTDLRKSLSNHLLGVRGATNKTCKLIWHYLLFVQEREQFARLFMMEVWSNPRFYNSKKSKPLVAYWDEVRDILQEGVAEGAFRKNIDVLSCQCMIFGTLNHVILSRVVFNKPFNLVDKGEEFERMFLDAMSPTYPIRESLWEVMGKKGAILEAALDEFDRRGYAQTTISQISSHAGITDPTLYEYFKSKEEILMAIPELAVDKFLNDLKQNLAQMDLPQNSFKLFLWNQMYSYETYPAYYRVLLGELRCNPKFYTSEAYTVIRRYTEELMAILKDGIKSGSFREDIKPKTVRHLYFGMLDQLLLYSMVRPGELRMSDKMERVYELIYNVIKKPFTEEGGQE